MLLDYRDWKNDNISSPTASSPSSHLTRHPTYQNLLAAGQHTPKSTRNHQTMTATPKSSFLSSSSSSSSSPSHYWPPKSTTRPQMRPPLLDLRTNRTSLGKVVGARAGWLKKQPTKITTPNTDDLVKQPIVVVFPQPPTKQPERPAKLCSHRLRSARSVFDGFAVSILKTGTVVLEKLAPSRDLITSIREIVQVSADGEAVTTAKLRQDVAFDSTRPTTIDNLIRDGINSLDVRTYRYETMPPYVFGRYRCAANFVSISRAKTPKIIINKTIKGKTVTCSLMESLVDCVVAFGKNCEITFLPDNSIRIRAGTATVTLTGDARADQLFSLPKPIDELLIIATKMRSAAISLEKTISSQPGFVQFPIQCGKLAES